MKAEIIEITIDCRTNEDYQGSYDKASIIEEMNELGYAHDTEHDWMDYVFNHVFMDEPDWTQELNDFFVMNDTITSMTVKLVDDIVTIRKIKRT